MNDTPCETPQDDKGFDKGVEIYYLDKNKVDIYLAEIQSKQDDHYIIEFKDHDAKPKKVTIDRILPKTQENDEIYLKQKEERENQLAIIDEEKKQKKLKKMKNEQIDDQSTQNKKHKKHAENEKEGEEKSDSKKVVKKKHTKVKKSKKQKKPLFDYNLIVRGAWQKGIHDPDHFKKFVKKNVKTLYEEYEQYYNIMNGSNDQPLFLLGGYSDENKSDKKEIKKFWSNSRSLWNKLFDDSINVKTHIFNKKLIEIMKLPNQTESNARAAIEFFFNPDDVEEVNYSSFCAFLALFSPYKTALRKIRDFFNIPPEFADNIVYTDPIDFASQDLESEINCIEVYANSENSILVYNLPHVPYGEEYLIDNNGALYKTWSEFFEKNPEPSQPIPIVSHEDTDDDSISDDDDDSIGEELNQKESNEDKFIFTQSVVEKS